MVNVNISKRVVELKSIKQLQSWLFLRSSLPGAPKPSVSINNIVANEPSTSFAFFGSPHNQNPYNVRANSFNGNLSGGIIKRPNRKPCRMRNFENVIKEEAFPSFSTTTNSNNSNWTFITEYQYIDIKYFRKHLFLLK